MAIVVGVSVVLLSAWLATTLARVLIGHVLRAIGSDRST